MLRRWRKKEEVETWSGGLIQVLSSKTDSWVTVGVTWDYWPLDFLLLTVVHILKILCVCFIHSLFNQRMSNIRETLAWECQTYFQDAERDVSPVGQELLTLHMTLGLAKSEVMWTSQPPSKRQTHKAAGAEGTLWVMGGAVFRWKLLVFWRRTSMLSASAAYSDNWALLKTIAEISFNMVQEDYPSVPVLHSWDAKNWGYLSIFVLFVWLVGWGFWEVECVCVSFMSGLMH